MDRPSRARGTASVGALGQWLPTRLVAVQKARVGESLRHIELFTLDGLLTLLWHDVPGCQMAGVTCSGAMGGPPGPARGLYHDLGLTPTARHIAVVRVDCRRPGDLAPCVVDAAIATQLLVRSGVRRVVTVGHSFGGAVAVRVGVTLPDVVTGVVTLSTQSAGCEVATALRGRPVLLVHGDRDELLPVAASEIVRNLTGGQLGVLEGKGHLLARSGEAVRTLLVEWITRVLSDDPANTGVDPSNGAKTRDTAQA